LPLQAGDGQATKRDSSGTTDAVAEQRY